MTEVRFTGSLSLLQAASNRGGLEAFVLDPPKMTLLPYLYRIHFKEYSDGQGYINLIFDLRGANPFYTFSTLQHYNLSFARSGRPRNRRLASPMTCTRTMRWGFTGCLRDSSSVGHTPDPLVSTDGHHEWSDDVRCFWLDWMVFASGDSLDEYLVKCVGLVLVV